MSPILMRTRRPDLHSGPRRHPGLDGTVAFRMAVSPGGRAEGVCPQKLGPRVVRLFSCVAARPCC